VFGAERVGVKVTPLGKSRDMGDSNPEATFKTLFEKLSEKAIGYICIAEGSGERAIENSAKAFRGSVKTVLITNYAITLEEGKRRLDENEADLVAWASNFIANPDLPDRLLNAYPLAKADWSLKGEGKGFSDYEKYVKPSI